MADMMYKVLTDSALSEELSKKGIKRSKRFNWDDAAKETLRVYEMFEWLLFGDTMKIDYINGLKTDKIFGRSKYQWEIVKRYENVELNIIEYEHIANILKRKFNIKPSKSVEFKKENTKNDSYDYNKVFNFVVDIIKEIFERIDQ